MRAIHHVAIFTASYSATADFYRETFGANVPAEAHQPSVIDLAEFVAVRDRLLARGACDDQVIDFGEHLSVLATDPDGGMVELLVPTDERDELPFEVVSHEAS